MLRHERLRELGQIAVHHGINFVKREIDTVIGDSALRKVISSNTFRAITGPELRALYTAAGL